MAQPGGVAVKSQLENGRFLLADLVGAAAPAEAAVTRAGVGLNY